MITKEESMHIAFSTNDKFAPHTATAIASLLSNTPSKREINIYIIHSDMNQKTISDLKLLSDFHSNVYIKIIKIDINEFKSFPIHKGVRAFETYFRLKLHTLLPEVEKIIYLDSDIIVCGDIEELWLKEIGKNFILAVEVPTFLHKKRLEGLGMKPESPYFNAGVLLMNLSKIRSSGLYKKITPLIEKKLNVLILQDQDILNILTEGQWSPLPLKYNAYWCILDRPKRNKFIYYNNNDLNEAVKNPFIIHFNGYHRTWEPGCIHPKAKLYWKFRDMTPFICPHPPRIEHLIKSWINKMIQFKQNYLPNTGLIVKLRALRQQVQSIIKS